MTVKELIEKLSGLPPDLRVRVAVGWAGDTALSDSGEDLEIAVDDGDGGGALIRGWMSGCGTELSFEGD